MHGWAALRAGERCPEIGGSPCNPWLELLGDDRPGDRLREMLEHPEAELPVFLEKAAETSAGPKPFHSGSVLDHMARCMNETAGDPLAVWLAMAHDAGKLTTPRNLLPHHYGHEKRGEQLAPLWAQTMKLPEEWAEYGSLAASQHMRAGRFFKMRPGKKLSLLQKLGASGIAKQFWKMVDADTRAPYSLLMLPLGDKVAEWEAKNLPLHTRISSLARLCKK